MKELTMSANPVELEHRLAAAQISDVAREIARTNFTANPARSTVSGPHNVAMRIPDPLSGESQELESRTLEYAQYLRLLHDPSVLHLATQPAVGVVIRDTCDPRHTWPSTPDFFVLWADRAGWIETRTEARIAGLVAKHEGLYVPTDRPGEYACPSAGAYAADRGLVYLVRTPAAFKPIETRNLRDLGPYFVRRSPESDAVEQLVGYVAHHPGVTITELAACGFAVADILWAIAAGRIYVDLGRHVVADGDHAPVYRDAVTAAARAHLEPAGRALGRGAPRSVSLERGARVGLADVVFEVEIPGATEIVLRDVATGTVRSFSRVDLERFITAGTAKRVEASPGDVAEPVAARRTAIYASASDAALDVATARAVALGLAPHDATRLTLPPRSKRTLRRWRQRRREQEAATADPMVGLIPLPRSGGGRRLHPRAFEVMVAVIKDHHLIANPKSSADIARLVRAQLKVEGLEGLAPAERTVTRHIRRISRHERVLAQLGRRAANGLRPVRPIDPDDTPVHGDRPWQVAHFDGTTLDIETVCPFTGVGLGRPNAGALVDAYADHLLVKHLHYASPGAATVLRALRRCVELHRRLPESIVLDQAPEFHSTALQRFCAWTGVTIIYRPTAQPRFGSPVERYMLELTRIVHRLRGQTKARKNPRSLDRAMDPDQFKVWDLRSLDRLMDDAIAILEDEPVQATGESRRARFERGLVTHGVVATRVFDATDPGFLAWTLPLVEGETRKVNAVTGISVNYLTYQHPALQAPELAGAKVEVRCDPDDAEHVFALGRDGWIECHARELRHVRVVSLAEWHELSEMLRQRHRAIRSARRLTGGAIAALILAGDENEKALLKRLQHQAETATPIQDALTPTKAAVPAPRPGAVTPNNSAGTTGEDEPDDLLADGERDVDGRYFDLSA